MEYKFNFYNPNTGKMHSITALVEDVYEDQIKVKYLKNNTSSNSLKPNCEACINTNCTSNKNYDYNKALASTADAMPSCGCILNPPDVSKYEGPSILFIPIANIVSVSYVISSNNSNNNENKNGGLYLMLLGVSATTIRAIIIRMAFFEDNLEEAVKYVDLKTGGIYDLTYEARDGAIYESRVKIMSIEDVHNGKPCKPGNGYVREHVGFNNGVYINCNKKDEFMNQPPVKKIKIIVDTSETFNGRYEAIMLDAIRDCTLVYDPSSDIEDNDNNIDYCNRCDHKTPHCHPDYCGHYIPMFKPNGCKPEPPAKTYCYTYDNMYKATVTGEKVSLNVKGKHVDINLDTLIKYYLGVE